jgi:hypothetical protein
MHLQDQFSRRSKVIARSVLEQEHSHLQDLVQSRSTGIAGSVAEQEHSDCRTSSRAGAQ